LKKGSSDIGSIFKDLSIMNNCVGRERKS